MELQGFKTYESTGNVVRIGEPKTVNAVLETGTLAETVQVVGGSETVQLSTSGNFGSVIDQRAIETPADRRVARPQPARRSSRRSPASCRAPTPAAAST